MNKKKYIHISLSVLMALSLISATAGIGQTVGHACCGRCFGTDTWQPHNETAGMQTVSPDCCPVVGECSCSLKSADGGDVDFPAANTGRSHKDNSSNPLLFSNIQCGPVLPGATTRMFDRTGFNSRSAPIYLLTQSFLC